MIYTGIGSRKTPVDKLGLMTSLAARLEREGWILRSGGAPGADQAFEAGVTNPKNKEIYLPWGEFEGSTSPLYPPRDWTYKYVHKFHPAPDKLSRGAFALQARNTHQIMGWDEKNIVLSDLVICWTPGGNMMGGTAQALRIANHFHIPIINLYEIHNIPTVMGLINSLIEWEE